jgi:hypothetical protein
MGSLFPNNFQMPNIFTDVYMPLVTGTEYKVLNWAIREEHTLHDNDVQISVAQFAQATGESVSACQEAIDTLYGYRLLACVDVANGEPLYALQLEESIVDIDGLRHRSWQQTRGAA